MTHQMLQNFHDEKSMLEAYKRASQLGDGWRQCAETQLEKDAAFMGYLELKRVGETRIGTITPGGLVRLSWFEVERLSGFLDELLKVTSAAWGDMEGGWDEDTPQAKIFAILERYKPSATVIVNGAKKLVADLCPLSYDDVINLAFGGPIRGIVTVQYTRGFGNRNGVLMPNQSITAVEGMVIDAVDTSKA